MLRITKDGFTIEADTQAELQIAIAALRSTQNDEPPLPEPLDDRYIPEQLVAEPHLSVVPNAEALHTERLREVGLQAAQSAQALNSYAAKFVPVVDDTVSSAVQMVPVRRKLLDILEVVLCFPEGISSKGVQNLTGLSDGAVGNRLTRLRLAGLAERVAHHHLWRATDLARRSKLVAS